MAMQLETMLVRAVAPAHLADAVIGDLHERRAALAESMGAARAGAICRAEALRSLPPLAACAASRALTENWLTASTVAAVICALCIAAIPLWDRIGFGGPVYHVLRLALIGLILGSIPRASSLSFAFLLLLIGISDGVIDAYQLGLGWRVLGDAGLYAGLFVDGAAMASTLIILRIVRWRSDRRVHRLHPPAQGTRRSP